MLLGITSCGTRETVVGQKSIYELLLNYLQVVEDSNSDWQTVKTVTTPLVESLCDSLSDEDDRGRRLSLQGIAYETILATIRKYYEVQGINGTEDDAGLDKIVGRLGDAIFQWFYDDNEEYPNIWRDHFYVSDKEAEYPIDGYFHLAVLLPTKDNPQPSVHIYYPETAEGNPRIMFRDFDEDGKEVKGRGRG